MISKWINENYTDLMFFSSQKRQTFNSNNFRTYFWTIKKVWLKSNLHPPASLHFTCNQWFLKSVSFAPCLPFVGFIKPKYLLAYYLENFSMAEHLLRVVFCFRSWKGLQWKWETTGFIDKQYYRLPQKNGSLHRNHRQQEFRLQRLHNLDKVCGGFPL